MTHTKYTYMSNEELISIAENSDDEMIIELVNRVNMIPDDDTCECGEQLVCLACDT